MRTRASYDDTERVQDTQEELPELTVLPLPILPTNLLAPKKKERKREREERKRVNSFNKAISSKAACRLTSPGRSKEKAIRAKRTEQAHCNEISACTRYTLKNYLLKKKPYGDIFGTQ